MSERQDPVWVRDDVVRSVHRRQLAEHGGAEGVRDEGLLASALVRPKNRIADAEEPPDLAALAAAYATGLLRNHPFVDGNKRTAYVICRTFLLLNGFDFTATQEEKYLTFLRAAEGSLDEDQLAAWLRRRMEPISKE